MFRTQAARAHPRFPAAARWAASVAVALLAGCAGLPKFTDEAPKAEAAAPSVPAIPPGDYAPRPPAAGTVAAGGDAPRTYPGTGTFVNPKAAPPEAKGGVEEASLNFEGLDVREAAKVILGDYLKESYTVHPGVAGTVTFRTVRPIPRAALLPTLEMLLRQNNAAVVREDGVYKIVPITAVRGSVSPQLGGAQKPIPQGYSVVVVPVRYVGAKEMARLLEPFAADNTVRVDEVRNLVMIAGNQKEMRHLLDAIELFDVDWLSGFSVGLFPIKSADVKALVADLDKVFGPTGQGPLAGIVRVIPIERLNALLVVTTQPKYLDMAKTWVERLDQLSGTSGGTRFFVYAVRNGKAENLAQLIGELFSSRGAGAARAPTVAPGLRPTEIRTQGYGMTASTTAAAPAPAAPAAATSFQIPGAGSTSGEVRVIADKDTNSLLILATPGDYEIIENALKKLDVVRRQVLVEVFLAEVKLTDDLKFGIEWFIKARNNTSGSLNLGGLPPTPADITKVPPFSGLQLINFAGGEVRAVLNALGEDGKTQVLASPQIMVLDNEKAEIKVGDRISVQTQSQTVTGTTGGLINSFQYLETGILLSVTPRINSGGLVTLDVNQEVSQADPASITTQNPNPNVATRNAKTSVVVGSGESIVLAGLIRESNGRSTAGVPLLSKIPVLGAAFGTQTISRERTELVLIITPRIVSDSNQAREATEELRKKLPALHQFLPKRELTEPSPVQPATR